MCGIEIDTEDQDESVKFLQVKQETCTDMETIDNLISECRIRGMRFKGNKMNGVIFSITEQIYNSYDIVHENDYNQLRHFIVAMFKLSKNRYRKIRYIGSLILAAILELLYDELSSTLKIIKQKKKNSVSSKSKDTDTSTLTLLQNKVKIFEELIKILKDKFIQKKISDISQNIRMLICECLTKISKNNFDLLFNDTNLIKYFPFFLNDPSPPIKIKYLQLLYDKLESTSEEDSKTLKILISILSIARDTILSISIKEDKVLAKHGIKIIELLSQHKILETKTVNQLLPHLFNPERQIRILLSKVVKNYILNFESFPLQEEEENREDEVNEEKDKEGDDSKEKMLKEKKIILTRQHVHTVVEFFHRLSDNEPNMLSILVDNFFEMLNIFKEIRLFFDYIDDLVSSNQTEMNLIHTAFLIMSYSMDKIQKRLEYDSEGCYFSINEEFINLFISNVSKYIKKFRLPIYDNKVNSTQCEILNTILELFSRLKIAQNNVITFSFDTVLDIVNELRQSFFINIITFAHNAIDNNKTNTAEIAVATEQVLFEKLCENLLKAIRNIMSSDMLFAFFNYNQAKFLDEIIFSDKTNSLAKNFCEMIMKEILNKTCYKTPNNDSINAFLNNNNNTKETLYIIFTQMNYVIVFFKDIFSNTSMINFNTLTTFLLKLLSYNIVNRDDDNDATSIDFDFKFNSMILSLIETIHLYIFEHTLETQNNIEQYLNTRNDIINTILSILVIEYDQRQTIESRNANNYLLHLKTKAIGVFLDTMTYISSEKLKVQSMRFELTSEIEAMLIAFTKDNFITFFSDYNRWFKKDIEEIKNLETQTNFCFNKKESFFNNELAIKTFCFKVFCEKFSRLILLNFGMFKYLDTSCLYFESFFLIKHQNVIDSIITYVFESLMEKEVLYYLSELNSKQNNQSVDLSINYSQSSLTIMIFYLSKITMKIFNNKSQLYNDLSDEDKIDMINRYTGYYNRTMKKLKTKYNKGDINICNKDKNFYENFILNGFNFALDSKLEIKKKKKDKTTIEIENVQFLEIIKLFLKMNLFLDEVDVKNMIIAYLKLSKTIEITDNVNIQHIKTMERFKTYLLNKGKVVLTKDEEAVSKSKRKKNKKNKKSSQLEEEDNDGENQEDGDDNDEDDYDYEDEEEDQEEEKLSKVKTKTPKKKNKKTKRDNSSSKEKSTTRKKKRTYNEMKDQEENKEDDNKPITTNKKKKIKKK